MSLLALSVELLQCVASSLQRRELLNVSLTCKYLRSATEPELFREYSNVSLHHRSFLPFLRRIIHRSDLRRHTRKLSLRSWTTLDAFKKREPESGIAVHETCDKRRDCPSIRSIRLDAADYALLAQAARDSRVIQDILPFDHSTWDPRITHETGPNTATPAHLDIAHASDRTFCYHLLAGSEDPLVVILISLLPNLKDIVFDGVPDDIYAWNWQPKHGFSALRTLTACAVDGELHWPFSFFIPLLAAGRLQVLKASHATSDRLQSVKSQPMVQELSQLALMPRTLGLKRVELENCCLNLVDLRSLLQRCGGLRSFFYTSRRCEVGSWSPSPAEFVKLLRPHQTTLHTLILDLDVRGYEDQTEDRHALIHSLAHMTALKVLVTTPEMWHSLAIDTVIANGSVEQEKQPLSMRVPPNVEILVFGLSEEEKSTSLSHISEIVRMRNVMLPHLTTLSIGGIDPLYMKEVRKLFVNLESLMCIGQQGLHAEVGPTYVRSVFDTGDYRYNQTEVRWAEEMYVEVPSGTSLFTRAYERIRRELFW